MKLLILGAGGMLGQALVKEFASEDIIVGDLPEFDLTKPAALEKKISAALPEVIINAAASTDVDGCETAKEICLAVNGQGAGDLAKIAKGAGAVLIHFSTDYVFNGQKRAGYQEIDQPKPLNIYGQSKALGEELLQQNTDKFYLIRTAWLFGFGGKNFIDTIIKLSKEKKELPVVNDQFGNPTYAKDLAAAVHKIILDKRPFGIYHLTNQGSCSWYELACKIKEIKNLNVNLIPISSQSLLRPAPRPKYSILINNKLLKLRPWAEALRDYLTNL